LLLLLALTACRVGPAEEPSAEDQAPLRRSTDEVARMRDYLAKLYEPGAVRETFVDDVGDAIDCVAFRAQPALRLQGIDPDRGRMPDEVDGDKLIPLLDGEASATGGDTRRCPSDTVSLRHYTLDDLVAYGTLDRFLQRNHQGQPVRDVGYEFHDHAESFHFAKTWGASTTLNVWTPPEVEQWNFSLSQMWVVAGERPAEQTVEAGWISHGGAPGTPHAPRLFVYSTSDGYQTGCQNAECGRFVKMASSQIVLDGAFTATSVQGGPQYIFTLRWQFCPASTCDAWAGWWLKYETAAFQEWVGFYPRGLFDSARLADGATQVSFGGEVYQLALDPHTSTDMGSGRFPDEGFRASAYQRSLRMISPENMWQPITDERVFSVERPDCYLHGGPEHAENWGDYFFFGGPGRSEACR
jgi:hypothetical protein